MKKILWLIITLSLCSTSTALFATVIDKSTISDADAYIDDNDYFGYGFGSLRDDAYEVIDLLRAGKRNDAKRLIAEKLKKNPSHPQILHIAGILLLEDKRYDNAQVAFEAALKSNPKNPPIVAKLGVTRILQGNIAKGKRLLNFALSMDRNDLLALRYLAWISEKEGQFGLAAGYLERLLRLTNPKQLNDLHLSLARVLSQAKGFEDSISLLSPFFTNPDDKSSKEMKGRVVSYLIESYIQTSRFRDAEALLNKSIDNKSVSELQRKVFNIEMLIRKKKSADANEQIEKAVTAMPINEHVIRYAAAKAYAREQKPKNSIYQLLQVAKFLDSEKTLNELSSALNDLNSLYIQEARKIDALRTMQGYVEKYPDSNILLYQLAELQITTGQLGAADKNIDKLLNNKPDLTDAYYLKGIVSRREKEHDKADSWFAKVNEINPKIERAWVQRSGNMIDKGDMGTALEILATAVKKNKTNSVLWFEYGALLFTQGEYEKAVEAYRQVLTFAPNHLPSIDNLAGSLLILEKDLPAALHFAEKAYTMEPSDTVLQLNYLEALLLNNKHEKLVSEAGKLKKSLDSFGKYHYVIGASYLQTGKREEGVKHLEIANKSDLEERLKPKISKLLDSKK